MKWKKSFRKIPAKVRTEITKLDSDNAKIIAGKSLSEGELESGVYSHLGLDLGSIEIGTSWDVLPDPGIGTASKRNSEGWSVVRKDLPKITKYFYQDIPIYRDAARNGWTTAAIPRDVYERDAYLPYLFTINVLIQERLGSGNLGIVFSIDEAFQIASPSFEEDLLFALNLLQENTGVSGVASANNPEFVFTSEISWELFPPGDLDEVVRAFSGGSGAIPEDVITERLELFEQFEPTEYLKGLGGDDHYVGPNLLRT
ncbi:MAG: hypothetical protein P8L68_18865 [Paracoccaceae bacterium]|nr:hypothetical protein [Paracoccaceae bacterium]MDG2260539.1 hypothetical protein [Paracoccaceae bacterium]